MKRRRTRMAGLAALAATVAAASGGKAAPAPTGLRPPDIYAIVVGYNGAAPGLPGLRFADDDAVRFALLMRGLQTGDRSARVWLLTDIDAETEQGLARAGLATVPDGPPTRTALFGALSQIASGLAARPPARPGDGEPVLYILYAGHGLDGRILLKPEGGAEAGLTGHELRAAIAELAHAAPALRTFLFLDACRSQSLFTERGSADAELGPDLAGPAAELERRATGVRLGVLTAAGSGKPAGEVGTLGAGYFSHVLASGMAGAADADGDDVVSFGELVGFVAFNTERLTGQRPWFAPPSGDLAAPVVDLRGRRARLELSTAPAGRYVVAAGAGRPIFAEAYNDGRRPLRLALPVGRYRVVRALEPGRPQQADVELRSGERVDLARVAWADDESAPSRPRGADADDGPSAGPAFTSAFTPEAVATLMAGFDAGRTPAATSIDLRHTLGVAAMVGEAPLGLGGAEPGLSVRYRKPWRHWFAGGRAELGRSTHDAGGAYHLERYAGWVEGGPRQGLGRGLELTLSATLGGAALVRRGRDGALSGDPFAPAAGAGGGLDLRVHAAWHLFVDVRYAAQWFRVDGTRHVSGAAAVALGVAVGL